MSRSRKKHRYQGSRAVDRTCRAHGGCPTCVGNRRHAFRRRALACAQQLADLGGQFPMTTPPRRRRDVR